MRGLPIARTLALLAGCGGDAADQPERADGKPWEKAPASLEDAVDGTVVVAGEATQADLPAGCPNRPLRFSNTTIDEFAMTATFHGVGEIAGEERTPYVERCTASFDGGWKLEARCEHYSPAGPPDGITLGGGGLAGCDLSRRVAMQFVDPPEGTRWVVLRRDGYSIAYPVPDGEPVNVAEPVTDLDSQRTLKYRAVSATGEVTEQEVEGYVAG